MDKILYQINIKGKVQGVWFRKYTKDEAIKIGVKGFVRNNLDNSVYVEAEGSKEQLNDFLHWLNRGSSMSIVSSVKYEIGELKNFNSFKITF